MKLKLSESVVVVTGASSGIGEATALRVAKKGARVVLAARREEPLEKVARKCRELGGEPLVVKTDVTREEDVKALAQRAIEKFGRIDVWINNAGVYMLSRFENTPPDAFRQVIETNFFGYVHGARAVLPQFRKQGHGTLINVSSVLGRIASSLTSAYVASKFAVTGFTDCLRMEQRDMPHIHVCTILPATIDTPLFQHAANYTGREIKPLPPVHSVDEVSTAILHCIREPKPETYVGLPKAVATMARMAPSVTSRVMAHQVRKHFKKTPSPDSVGNLFQSKPPYARLKIHKNGHSRQRGGKVAAGLGVLIGACAAVATIATILRQPRKTSMPWQRLGQLVGTR